MGLIPANRNVFSVELAAQMRARTIRALENLGLEIVVPGESLTRRGCVETLEEAQKVGRLFRERRVDGVVIGAMNFGDEQGVAFTLKESGLSVPLFVFGGQEEGILTPDMERRDSFCGLISICEVLREAGCKYTVASKPVGYPEDEVIQKDLADFAGVCRVVAGLRSARIGQVGARPDPFWTCRFDERSLQRLGVTVVTLDLSEAIARVRELGDYDEDVEQVVEEIEAMAHRGRASDETLRTMAKFEVALREFVEERKLDALAIQCWTSLQRNLGICSCTAMARLGEIGIPCACEADVVGALSMYALQLAADGPAALADWNNLHPEEPEVVNLWHCGVYPTTFLGERPTVERNENLMKVLPAEQVVGTLQGRMQAGPLTMARITEVGNGHHGIVLCEGEVVDVAGTTYGAYGWTRVPGLQELYRNVILEHFPHHVAFTRGSVGNVLYEATSKYLGFKPFFHGQRTYGEYETTLPFARQA